MALKAIISAEEFAKLSDPLKGEYRETKAGSGKYLLDVSTVEGFALEDVVGLKSALGKERSARETLEAAQKAFEGLDPKAAREALKALEDLQKNPLDEKIKTQVEARERALTEKFGLDLKAKEAEASDYRKQLEEHLVSSAATAAIAKHKGVIPLLLPHVLSQVRVEKNAAGKFVAKVVAADGTPRISLKQGSSENMSIDELVESMRGSDTFGVAFEGSKSTGTGAGGAGAGGAGSGATVSIRDQKALNNRMEDIASGKVTVVE